MTSLAQTVSSTNVANGTIKGWWLGGSGFVFKTPVGTQIYIDPYFSNCVASIFGLDRDFPAPISAPEARPDLVVSTHWHEDHLDPEGLPIVARHSQARFLCPPSCVSRLLGWQISRDRVAGLKVGETYRFRDMEVTAVPARHVANLPGWEVEDAIGVLLNLDGLRIYHSGDTEYDLRLRALAYDRDITIEACMLAINGTGGNMNAHEAALLAWQLRAKTIIPMHHRLWKNFSGGEQATLDPRAFADTYHRLGGLGEVRLLEVGEGFELSSHRTS